MPVKEEIEGKIIEVITGEIEGVIIALFIGVVIAVWYIYKRVRRE